MSEIPQAVLDGYQGTIEAFVRRARRLEAHSLLADTAQFIAWVHGSARLDIGEDGGEVRLDLPPEEAFESLAARVRPLLLEQDGIHFSRILAAIGAFGRDDDDTMRARAVLKRSWERITGSEIVGFAVSEPVDGAPLVPDIDLAHGWLYGDLVHADSTAAPGALAASLNQRYVAAVLIYGQAAMAAVATLNVVRTLVAKGLVELDPVAEASQVVVSTPMMFPVHAARISPAGTMPTTGSAPPAGTAGPAAH